MREERKRTTTAGGQGVPEVIRLRYLPDTGVCDWLSIAIVIFVVGSLVFQEGATKLFGDVRVWLTTNLDWLFMITVNLVCLFCLIVAFSPLGKIRLGGADAKPEYSNITWLAMLFAAGIGIGLLFFGVAEPMYYLQNPPLGITARNSGGCYRRHSSDGFPLGNTRLGSLRRRRTRSRVFRLQPGTSPYYALGILSHIR